MEIKFIMRPTIKIILDTQYEKTIYYLQFFDSKQYLCDLKMIIVIVIVIIIIYLMTLSILEASANTLIEH